MHFSNALFLQAGAPQPGGGWQTMIIMPLMLVVFYFFFMRPQKKKQDAQKKFGEAIAPSEVIVTTAGIHGRIQRVNDDGTLQLEIARGTFITIERNAVSMEMTNALRNKAGGSATAVTAGSASTAVK